MITKHENGNTREQLDSLVVNMHKLLKMLEQAPSVQMQVTAGQLATELNT